MKRRLPSRRQVKSFFIKVAAIALVGFLLSILFGLDNEYSRMLAVFMGGFGSFVVTKCAGHGYRAFISYITIIWTVVALVLVLSAWIAPALFLGSAVFSCHATLNNGWRAPRRRRAR